MNLKKTIENLRKRERDSKRKGYMGDATEYAFKRHLLLLLSKKVKRKPSAWSIFLGNYLKEGKTIQQASIDWKKQQK